MLTRPQNVMTGVAISATLLLTGLTSTAQAQDAVQWRVEDGGNGHWYEGINHGNVLGWHEARELAERVGGHLATPSTTVESSWIKNNIAGSSALWTADVWGTSFIIGPWIGGLRPAGGSWGWVDDSEWSFESWHPGNPDSDPNNESGILFWDRTGSFAWQDDDLTVPSTQSSSSYIIEWSADCNNDGIVDYGQILDGTLTGLDVNDNGVPDVCEAIQWRVEDGGNGHWYLRTETPEYLAYSWEEAQQVAESSSGYLVCIESADEQAWIQQNLPTASNGSFFIGLSQDPGGAEPDGGWGWVNGSPLDYTNWNGSEPNDSNGGEDYAIAFKDTQVWVDVIGEANTPVLVEYSSDYNNDGIVDFGQILNGTLVDCNGNGIPDSYELNDTLGLSVDRTPESPTDFIEFDVSAMSEADGEVSMSLSVVGELAATSEFMYVYLDDLLLGLAFSTDGLDCEEVRSDFIITASEWNDAGLDGARLIRVAGLGIAPNACAQPRTSIYVTVPLVTPDCNANGIWDGCEADGDSDGTIDACDDCPSDPLETDPGACGCGIAETDTDDDGTPDCIDPCPQWPGDCSADGQTLFVVAGESIQAAIDVAPLDGTIRIAAGTFAENLNIEGSSIQLIGEGAEQTTLDGSNLAPVIRARGVESVQLSHLRIINGYQPSDLEIGGGISAESLSSLSIEDCIIEDNQSEYQGGGLTAMNVTMTTVLRTTFRQNLAGPWGGCCGSTGGAAMIRGFGGGGPCSGASSAVFDDCVFVENQASINGNGSARGGAIGFDNAGNGTLEINACLFEDNSADSDGNCLIIAGSCDPVTSQVSIENTTMSGGGQGSSTISGFEDGTDVPLTIQNSTLCQDSQSDIVGMSYEDLGGNCFSNSCFDTDQDGILDGCDGCPNDPDKTEPGACGCGIADTDTDGDSIPDCIDPCPDWAYDCSEDGSVLQVPAGASLETALTLVPAGGTLELGAGSFELTASLDPGGKAVIIQGALDEDGSLATTIDARGNGSVMVFQSGEEPDTEVRNLILTGGSATYGGGIECSNNSNPTIVGCLITGNVASDYGGGVNCYLNCAPLIQNCTITGNSAGLGGGGISVDQSEAEINACVIQQNDAPAGGALYCVASPNTELSGSILCGNTVDQTNGDCFDYGDNCILEDCGDDLDGNGVPDGCDPDCDGDGEPDAWEIESGQDLDCDFNGVPDACDVANGFVEDCDENGIPDSCDIAEGAEDDNENGLLDECELAAGDLDLDGCVTGADLAILLGLWGLPNPPVGDLNGDGIIDGMDLATLLANWGCG